MTESLPRARRDDLVTRSIDGEVIIYDESNDTAHALSSSAATVWAACDGATPVAVLAATLGEQATREALAQLAAAGLLEVPAGTTRRNMLLGAAAGGAVMVATLAAPSAAMAASNGTSGTAVSGATYQLSKDFVSGNYLTNFRTYKAPTAGTAGAVITGNPAETLGRGTIFSEPAYNGGEDVNGDSSFPILSFRNLPTYTRGGLVWPQGTVFGHPGNHFALVVGLKIHAAGTVNLSATAVDFDADGPTGLSDGVIISLAQQKGAVTTTFADSVTTIPNGGGPTTISEAGVPVAVGDLVFFILAPGPGGYDNDSTGIDFTVTYT